MTPQLLARASLILLLALAFVLLMPFVNLGLPPAWLVVLLLGLRLGVRVWAAVLSGSTRTVAFDVVLTVLIGYLILSPSPAA